MKFEDIVKEWEVDREFDIYDVANEIARVPQLEQKYLNYYMVYKSRVKKLQQELAVNKRDLTDYYMGRAEKPSPVRIIKTESPTYIAADEVYQKTEEKLEFASQAVMYLEKILERIKSRPFDLRAAMEWQKFTSGGR